jgi:DNA-binding NarL/FixJ family response regulator
LRDLKIVLIDDSEIIREKLRRAFAEAAGCHLVGMAVRGEDGFEIVRTERPDIVILDLCLPHLSGLETLRRIREEDQRVLIVMFSGDDSVEMREACRTAGANFYIIKTQVQDLLALLQLARRIT